MKTPFLVPFYIRFLWKKYPFLHFCRSRFRYPNWVICQSNSTPSKKYPFIQISGRICLPTQVPSGPPYLAWAFSNAMWPAVSFIHFFHFIFVTDAFTGLTDRNVSLVLLWITSANFLVLCVFISFLNALCEPFGSSLRRIISLTSAGMTSWVTQCCVVVFMFKWWFEMDWTLAVCFPTCL